MPKTTATAKLSATQLLNLVTSVSPKIESIVNANLTAQSLTEKQSLAFVALSENLDFLKADLRKEVIAANAQSKANPVTASDTVPETAKPETVNKPDTKVSSPKKTETPTV
jgi:hypothetical protein